MYTPALLVSDLGSTISVPPRFDDLGLVLFASVSFLEGVLLGASNTSLVFSWLAGAAFSGDPMPKKVHTNNVHCTLMSTLFLPSNEHKCSRLEYDWQSTE